MTAEDIKHYLKTECLGRNLIYLEECDSTQIVVRDALRRGAPHGTAAVASYQTMGRGRRGRSWNTGRGSSIAMSVGLRLGDDGICLSPEAVPRIALLCGMAVAEATETLTGEQVCIKWPNDVIMGNRKICGILAENCIEPDGARFVIAGIGINVTTESFPEDIRDIATSIYLETGKKLKRSRLAAEVLSMLEEKLEIFMRTQDMSVLKKDYSDRLINTGKEVRILDPKGEYTGYAVGIDDDGALIVDDGKQRIRVDSGEVSVRGLYGYV